MVAVIFICINMMFQTSFIEADTTNNQDKDPSINIVMLGNSLTHGGNWNKLFNRNDVAEFGLESDSLKGFIKRAENVIKLKPKLCVIMGGINDIYKWEDTRTIFTDYKTLIKKIKNSGITPVIQSTLYAAKSYPHAVNRNKEVKKLNDMLKKYCLIRKIKFIDLNNKLANNQYLKEEITWDGIHLNKKGYRMWADIVNEYLKNVKF